jgi:hypothetical protein
MNATRDLLNGPTSTNGDSPGSVTNSHVQKPAPSIGILLRPDDTPITFARGSGICRAAQTNHVGAMRGRTSAATDSSPRVLTGVDIVPTPRVGDHPTRPDPVRLRRVIAPVGSSGHLDEGGSTGDLIVPLRDS